MPPSQGRNFHIINEACNADTKVPKTAVPGLSTDKLNTIIKDVLGLEQCNAIHSFALYGWFPLYANCEVGLGFITRTRLFKVS